MIWWLLAVFFFLEFGHGGDRTTMADSMLDNTYYNECPLKCSCLDDFLDCANINLSTVPPIPAFIISLDLSHNELADDINKQLGNMTKLKDLKLHKNRLQKFPIFIGLTTLQTLQLSSNKIETIELAALMALPQLTTLDLSRNSIKTVLPNSFPVNNHIIQLNLNNNGIRDLQDDSFKNLNNLHELKLNHNRLAALPAELFSNLLKLKRLELNGNSFSTIKWITFRNLSKLRVLKLRNNNLTELKTGTFHVLQNLLILELDNNNLTVIQKGTFYNLGTLNSISLSNNSINKIDQNAWEGCQRLTNIDLSMNKLTVIDTNSFECLNKLKELNLKQNDISTINEGAFNCTPNLDFLDLSHNQISWTIEDMNAPFSVLSRLDRLYLGENKIKSVNKNAFVGLTALTHLDMTANNITTMQLDAFAKLPALKELMLNTTNLLCDCNMLWFYNWLQTGYSRQVDAFCAYPSIFRGRSIQSLSKSNFTCNAQRATPTPRIIESPQTQLAIMARNVTLTCAATSSSSTEMTFKWKRNDVELNDAGPNEMTTESSIELVTNNTIATSRLQLRNVSHAHAGKYQCTVSNSYGTTYSAKIRITVASFPVFMKIPSNVTQNSTSIVRLDCAADGDPKPQMAWQKDGGNDFPAARERRMHVMPDDNAFFIVNAKICDQGVYTCTAENPAGIIKVNATVTILEPPTFVKPMENKEAIAGISSVLECMASGSPKPSLRWLKDGKPIEVTERHFFAAEEQLLIITGVRDADAGTYTCIMTNELGVIRGIMQLKVTAAPIVVKAEEMTGIVIITVVCCAVGTSIIWVVIIYQTKKGRGCTGYVPSDVTPSADQRRRYDGNNGAAVRLMASDVSSKVVSLNENESLLDRYTHQKMIVPLGRSGVSVGQQQHQLQEQLQQLHVSNHSPSSDYNYDDVSCIDSGTGDSAKRSTTDFYSDNGTSEMCCIEIDKSSPTVSFKTSPTTTPCQEDEEHIDEPDNFSDVTPTTQLNISSISGTADNSEVNIQTNKLNEFLLHHHLNTIQTVN